MTAARRNASDEVRDNLWNDAIGPSDYEGTEKYQSAVMEQYKIYVEMADRVSARRASSNTFFLTLNSAVLTVFGVFWRNPATGSVWLVLPVLIALLGQCVAWFLIVRSYRLLNSGKYAVVGVLEQRLPALAYSRGEWRALGEGADWRKYLPLTHVEQWIPVLFGVVYVIGFAIAVVASA